MINNKINKTLDFIDLDPKFIFSILRKYLIHLFFFVTLVTTIIYLFSLNLDKKYKSFAKIVIEPDDKNIVNIQEYNNIIKSGNRINNQIAIFKSDQVLEYIIQDKENNPRLQVNSINEYLEIMNNLKLDKPNMMDSNVASNVKGLTL